jgi:hypothetical protein
MLEGSRQRKQRLKTRNLEPECCLLAYLFVPHAVARVLPSCSANLANRILGWEWCKILNVVAPVVQIHSIPQFGFEESL